MAKLLQIFEKYSASPGTLQDVSSCMDQIREIYSVPTLMRLLSSARAELRQASAWAIGHLGAEHHMAALGECLRDTHRSVRTFADEARRSISQRTQSPWHRETAMHVEQLMADGNFDLARELASHLVEEADRRSDSYMLRAWVRFSDGDIHCAADDCKRTLSIDPYCYQACVALGQCLWHMGRQGAARECYCEAARIYPDWEPARVGLAMLTD